MNTLVKKMEKLGLLKLEMIGGTVFMALAMLGLPVSILFLDASLYTEPMVIGVVAIGMLFFGLVGYFVFLRPYILYRKLPEIQAQTDGEFLYIHANKEAKIPLNQIGEATVRVDLPYILQKEFLREFVIHLFSGEYGTVILEIPGIGNYKMRFVANVHTVADELIRYIQGVIDGND